MKAELKYQFAGIATTASLLIYPSLVFAQGNENVSQATQVTARSKNDLEDEAAKVYAIVQKDSEWFGQALQMIADSMPWSYPLLPIAGTVTLVVGSRMFFDRRDHRR